MQYIWLTPLRAERHLWKPVSLHLSLVTSLKLSMTANEIVRSLVDCPSPSTFTHSKIFHNLFLMSAYVLQALYFQFGIKLHNVVDTQVGSFFWLLMLEKWLIKTEYWLFSPSIYCLRSCIICNRECTWISCAWEKDACSSTWSSIYNLWVLLLVSYVVR